MLSHQKSRTPPRRDSWNFNRASSPSQPSRIEWRRKSTPPAIWRVGAGEANDQAPRSPSAAQTSVIAFGVMRVRARRRVAASEIFRLINRVRIPSCVLTRPCSRRSSASASSAAVLTSRGGSTAATATVVALAGSAEPQADNTAESREAPTSARASGAGSRVSTMAPPPIRWTRSGSTEASRTLRSQAGLAAMRSGRRTIRPGGRSTASRDTSRAPLPSRTPSRISREDPPPGSPPSTYTRSKPARAAASAARRTRGSPSRNVSPVGDPGTASSGASTRVAVMRSCDHRPAVIPPRAPRGAAALPGVRRCDPRRLRGRARSSARH